LFAACTAAPVPENKEMQTAEQDLAPAWKQGDTWTVHYREHGGGIGGMAAVPGPPGFEENRWMFRVDARTPEGVHISAQSEEQPGGRDIWRFVFAPNGRLLHVINPWGDGAPEPPADTPIFELSRSLQEEVADAWPRFPLDEDFGVDDAELRQRSRPAGNELEVTLVHAGYDRWLEVDLVRTATQRWEAGRPWWSILRIEQETTGSKGTTAIVEIEAEVIAWPASTP
jgi:hypothetical protein